MRSSTRALLFGLTFLTAVTGGCRDVLEPTVAEPTIADPSFSLFGNAGLTISITVSPASDTIAVGDTLRLATTARDSRGRVNANPGLAWSSSNNAVATVSPTGLVKGIKAGSVVINAKTWLVAGSSKLTVIAAPPGSGTPPTGTPPTGTPPTGTPPTGTPPTTNSWKFCTNAGSMCEFLGLRDVRLGGSNGGYVQQAAYHSVPCAVYGFNNVNPAPGQSLHCDIGPIKTTALTNPAPGMAGLGQTVTVPMGSPGAGTALTKSTGETGVYTDGSGSFRTTCSLARFTFDDPIVFPGQSGASHLHVYFGNTGVTANSTPQSVANSGNSTCRGGILNRTGYWAPAVIDSRTGEVQMPDEAVFYYKTGYNMDPATIRTIPVGLRMIAGDKNAMKKQDFVAEWGCANRGVQNDGTIPTTCGVGDAVRLTVYFPQCWDGVNLDSPDHKSHMAYPTYRNSPQRSTCPSTHPVPLPAITEHFDYPITSASSPANWRLSSDMYSTSTRGGLSAHADWMGGWDPATMNTIVTKCLNKALDCGVGSIGNGTALYY